VRYLWNMQVLFLLISPLSIYAIDNTTIDSSLQRNLDWMVSHVEESKEIIGFDSAGYSNVNSYKTSVTFNTCNDLLGAIQKKQVILPTPIIRTDKENYNKYYDYISKIVSGYADAEKKRLKAKGHSVKNYDDEISLILEKDLYKEFSLLSLVTENNRLEDTPYKMIRMLYQSSVDNNKKPRYLEAIFSRYPNENNIRSLSVNALSMDGHSGHSLTAYDFLSIRGETHFNSFGFFSLKGKVYIWVMEEKPHPMIQENWLHNSNYVLGPNLSGTNEIIDYLENTKWDHDLFIASPIGSDDESHCQFYLKGRK